MATATMTRAAPKAKGRPQPAADRQAVARAAGMFKLLGDATRLQVVLLLAEGERNVGVMCAALGMTQPALSHHIAICRHAGLITPRRSGKNNFYSLTDRGREAVRAARAAMAN